jgi:hypothetical protein
MYGLEGHVMKGVCCDKKNEDGMHLLPDGKRKAVGACESNDEDESKVRMTVLRERRNSTTV